MGVSEDLTPRQRQAVEAQGRRVCVAAGPGSGKTRVLVHRVADRVEAGRLDLHRTLALTFTENAAGEMKQRLAERFEQRGLESQRRQVEQASISTIHGFCARLLREHAIEAGVDPRFRVLDELEANLLKSSVLATTLDRLRDREPEEYIEFAVRFSQGSVVAKELLDVYDTIRRLGGDPQDRDALLLLRHSLGEILQGVEERLRRLEEGVRGRHFKYRQAVREIREGLRRARASAHLDDALAGIDQALEAIDLTRLAEPDLKPSFRVLRGDTEDSQTPPPDSLRVLAAALVEEYLAPHRRRLADVLAAFDRAYAAHKRRISALDFDDLERHALQLLANPERAAEAGARFQEILVDEYQDTSEMQARIIEGLSAGPRLFVVGDPKQSIYAFRNAEPRNFDRAWEQAGAERGDVALRQDFRSRPEILAAVNTFFLNVPGLAGAVPFEPLEAGSDFEPQEEPSVEVLISCAGKGVIERRHQEARRLARRIRELIEDDGLRITMVKATDCGHPLQYGDVAMLFRSTTDMGLYESALAEEGVPYFAETGRGFYDAREVADVVNFLRVLDNARDEVALAAVLRSPLCGLSDDALYLLAARAREKSWTRLADALAEAESLGLPDDDLERLRSFREVFARRREESARLPLDSLVREMVAATGYEAILMNEPQGRRRVANLRKLAEVARALSADATGLDSPGQFARAVDQFRLGQVREGEAQLGLPLQGAVRLMTMHAAKGLEFPVVVLPDLSRGEGSDKGGLDYLPEFGLGFKYLEDRPTLSFLNIRWAKQIREDQEEKRVLFVAMTRAMEHLVLSGSGVIKKDGTCGGLERLGEICQAFGLGPLQPTNSRRRETVGAHPFEIAILVTDRPAELPRGRAAEEPVAAVPEGAPPAPPGGDSSDFAAAVTDVMEFQACPRRYYLGRYLGFSRTAGPRPEAGEEAEDGDEFPATDLGLAVHKLLAGAPEALAGLPEAARAEAQALARRFQESELGRRLAAMKGAQREEPVFGEVEGRFLRGVLDLCAGPLIVDYKAGREDARRYGLQMLLYALLSGAREAVLFYLAEGRAVPVELTAEAFDEARSVVRRFFEAQRTLDFPAIVESHCFQCPFSGNLCREPQRQWKAEHHE